jgi:hypothetical protein
MRLAAKGCRMGIFDWLFGKGKQPPASRRGRRYEFVTGNVEFAIRLNRGEPFHALVQEIKSKWTPGNEHLWDDYDVESLIDSDEKKNQVVNQLLYSRITIYRALREKGMDIKGKDPFEYIEQAEEQITCLKVLFPALFPKGSLSVPVWPGAQLLDSEDAEPT